MAEMLPGSRLSRTSGVSRRGSRVQAGSSRVQAGNTRSVDGGGGSTHSEGGGGLNALSSSSPPGKLHRLAMSLGSVLILEDVMARSHRAGMFTLFVDFYQVASLLIPAGVMNINSILYFDLDALTGRAPDVTCAMPIAPEHKFVLPIYMVLCLFLAWAVNTCNVWALTKCLPRGSVARILALLPLSDFSRGAFFRLLVFVYPVILRVCLSVYDCIEVTDEDVRLLRSAPAIECWTSRHIVMTVVLSVVALVTVTVPFVLMVLLRKLLRGRDTLKRDIKAFLYRERQVVAGNRLSGRVGKLSCKTAATDQARALELEQLQEEDDDLFEKFLTYKRHLLHYGHLHVNYRSEVSWWYEAWFLCRRSLVIVIFVATASDEAIQRAAIIAFLCLVATIHAVFDPFKARDMNFLQMVLFLTNILIAGVWSATGAGHVSPVIITLVLLCVPVVFTVLEFMTTVGKNPDQHKLTGKVLDPSVTREGDEERFTSHDLHKAVLLEVARGVDAETSLHRVIETKRISRQQTRAIRANTGGLSVVSSTDGDNDNNNNNNNNNNNGKGNGNGNDTNSKSEPRQAFPASSNSPRVRVTAHAAASASAIGAVGSRFEGEGAVGGGGGAGRDRAPFSAPAQQRRLDRNANNSNINNNNNNADAFTSDQLKQQKKEKKEKKKSRKERRDREGRQQDQALSSAAFVPVGGSTAAGSADGLYSAAGGAGGLNFVGDAGDPGDADFALLTQLFSSGDGDGADADSDDIGGVGEGSALLPASSLAAGLKKRPQSQQRQPQGAGDDDADGAAGSDFDDFSRRPSIRALFGLAQQHAHYGEEAEGDVQMQEEL